MSRADITTGTSAAAPVHTKALTPSEEQITLAWRQMRGRGGAPATLADALRHPIWSRALHGLAVQMGRRTPAEAAGAANAAAMRLGGQGNPLQVVPPTPTAPRLQPVRRNGPNLWSQPLPPVVSHHAGKAPQRTAAARPGHPPTSRAAAAMKTTTTSTTTAPKGSA